MATHLDPLAQLRMQRDVAHLYGLGPRGVFEFLLKVSDQIGGLPAITRLLTEYRRQSPAQRRAGGAP
jgi:hypothetical protein